MDATAKTRNVKSRIWVYLQTLSITGSPNIVFGDQPSRAGTASPWIRAVIDFDPGSWNGRYSATKIAYRTPVIVTFDLFWPIGGDAASAILQIEEAADVLSDAFRERSLSFLDYASDPSSPATIANASIRFFRPVNARRLPRESNFQRRQIVAQGEWHIRH